MSLQVKITYESSAESIIYESCQCSLAYSFEALLWSVIGFKRTYILLIYSLWEMSAMCVTSWTTTRAGTM